MFGTRIAFARRTGNGRKQIFSVDCDGENLAQVSAGRRLNFTPAWGPGGIYFSSQTPDGFLALFRQGRAEPVLRADGLVMGAAFGGSRMAVVLTRDGNSEIYVGSPDGGGLRRLTNDPGADITPVWSPDGSKIAFVSDRSGGPQVYVMDAGGGGQRRVSFQGTYNTGPLVGARQADARVRGPRRRRDRHLHGRRRGRRRAAAHRGPGQQHRPDRTRPTGGSSRSARRAGASS